MKSKNLNFKNKEGKELSGILHLPVDDKPIAIIIFAHCFTCNKDLRAVRNLSAEISSQGLGIFLFDFTGLGKSDGDFSDTNFSSNVDDLIKASKMIEKRFPLPQVFLGHSLGGAAVLKAASNLSTIKAIATIGAPFNPFHVTKLFSEKIEEIKSNGKATVNIGGRPFKLSRDFIHDLDDQNQTATIKNLRRPLLVMHSPQDTIVGIENAASIYQAAHHPKSFISLNNADHLLSDKRHSTYAAKMVANWVVAVFEKNDEATLIKTKEEEDTVSEGFVRAKTYSDSFATPVLAGSHRLLIDEPESLGGSDLGPTPYDLLAGSLAACTTLTIQMYAQRKKWPLEEVVVEVKHSHRHKIDCEESVEIEKKIDHFEKIIYFEGELSDDQINRLKDIANRCPVHRTLENEIEIDSQYINRKNAH